MTRLLAPIVSALVLLPAHQSSGKQQACSPDSPSRLAAINVAREIHTRYRWPRGDVIYPFTEVPNSDIFTVSGVENRHTGQYMFMVRPSTLAPCTFVLFSDHDGVIYEGAPIR